MPPRVKATNWALYAKMAVAGTVCCVGGPALILYISPTEEELFSRYNPDLQRRSLENRIQKQQDFDDFVTRLKEHSKSDKPIWVAARIAENKAKENQQLEQSKLLEEMQKRKEEMRKEGISPVPGGSL